MRKTDEEEGLHDEELQQRVSLLNDRVVSSERLNGITRIHQQISQVNSLFRDLSSMVISQGEGIATIEQNSERSAENTRQSASELKISYDRRKQLKDVIMILAVIVVFMLGLNMYNRVRSLMQ